MENSRNKSPNVRINFGNFFQPCGLEEAVNRLSITLSFYLMDIDETINVEEYCTLLSSKMDNGEINEKYGENKYMAHLRGSEPWPFIDHPLIYYIEANKQLNTGDREAAWFALSQAKYYLGLMGHFFEIDSNIKISTSLREARSKGGLERTKSYDKAYQKFAELLNEKKPGQGWSSQTEAIEGIEDALKEFMVKNTPLINLENLTEKLHKWINNQTIIKKAYKLTRAEKV